MRARIFLLPLLAFSLTACGTIFPGLIGGKTPVDCTPPGGVQVALIYPAPGATGIPDNIGEIALASSGTTLNGSYSAELKDITAGNIAVANFEGLSGTAPSAIPTPQATPPFSNAQYEASVNSGYVIPAGHQMGVYLNQSSSGCLPSNPLGTFTAQ